MMKEGFRPSHYLCFSLVLALTLMLCVGAGSVSLPLSWTARIIWNSLFSLPLPEDMPISIIMAVRLPRVLAAGLVGAALALSGCAMQGLLRNPLADGSTLGVSSGASLGAALALAFGLSLPGNSGVMGLAMVFAFLSLLTILGLAFRLDHSLSTNTIILLGVIYSMFAGSLVSLVTTFAGERARHIVFWTMGSLSGCGYGDVLTLLLALAVLGAPLLACGRELNAFSLGEAAARHIGVDARRVKLIVLICVAGLIGVCVSISGAIGFVGLVIPHMLRLILGANHRRLLPASLFGGAIFLAIADLLARILLSPRELPIGVITSFFGAIVFVLIFYRNRRRP